MNITNEQIKEVEDWKNNHSCYNDLPDYFTDEQLYYLANLWMKPNIDVEYFPEENKYGNIVSFGSNINTKNSPLMMGLSYFYPKRNKDNFLIDIVNKSEKAGLIQVGRYNNTRWMINITYRFFKMLDSNNEDDLDLLADFVTSFRIEIFDFDLPNEYNPNRLFRKIADLAYRNMKDRIDFALGQGKYKE